MQYTVNIVYNIVFLQTELVNSVCFIINNVLHHSGERILKMHGENQDMKERLQREIKYLKEKLVRIDKDKTRCVDSITKNIKRILDVLQRISARKIAIKHCTPIYDLLSVIPLTRTEVPLDVLDQLISVGFDVNCCDFCNRTCLDIAVEKHHYSAVRILVKHGAKSITDGNNYNYFHTESPVMVLASQPNVPLDLFDLLATPRNLNLCSPDRLLPLHKAVSCGHAATALHLIELGARVNQKDGWSRLPIEYFIANNPNQFKTELFMSILPRKGHHALILGAICKVLKHKQQLLNENNPSMFEMLHQLLQRIHLDNPWNNVRKNARICSTNSKLHQHAYLHVWHAVLVELQFESVSIPRRKRKISEDTELAETKFPHVRMYDEDVKSLLRLCILQTRNSMSSLDDESFLSLPVPPYIRKLLTYRDVSEKVFEKLCEVPNEQSTMPS